MKKPLTAMTLAFRLLADRAGRRIIAAGALVGAARDANAGFAALATVTGEGNKDAAQR